jgi:hypothetical protein
MWTTDSSRQPLSQPPPAGGRGNCVNFPIESADNLPPPAGEGRGGVQYGQNDVQSQVDQVRTEPESFIADFYKLSVQHPKRG